MNIKYRCDICLGANVSHAVCAYVNPNTSKIEHIEEPIDPLFGHCADCNDTVTLSPPHILIQVTWCNGTTEHYTPSQLEIAYSATTLFDPDTWSVWLDGKHLWDWFGGLFELIPEMEVGQTWTCAPLEFCDGTRASVSITVTEDEAS